MNTLRFTNDTDAVSEETALKLAFTHPRDKELAKSNMTRRFWVARALGLLSFDVYRSAAMRETSLVAALDSLANNVFSFCQRAQLLDVDIQRDALTRECIRHALSPNTPSRVA